MGVCEPLRAGVVEVRQRALLQRLRRVLVARNRTLRIAGNGLVHPLDPLGRVEPPVAQLDELRVAFGGANETLAFIDVADVDDALELSPELLEDAALHDADDLIEYFAGDAPPDERV